MTQPDGDEATTHSGPDEDSAGVVEDKAVEGSTTTAARWRRPSWLTRSVVVAAGVAALVGLLAGVIGGWLFTGIRGGSAGSCDTTRVARDVLPSVVTIAAQGPSGSGTGSGAITSADGVIVTNDHVISVAARNGRIDVRLSDGTTKASTLVGHDPKTDLAVLKVDATNLPVIAIGDATALQVGQPVIALGAPWACPTPSPAASSAPWDET